MDIIVATSIGIVIVCFILVWVYAYRRDRECQCYDRCNKMKESMVNGAVRSFISGFLIGGAEMGLASTFVTALVNPIMTYVEYKDKSTA